MDQVPLTPTQSQEVAPKKSFGKTIKNFFKSSSKDLGETQKNMTEVEILREEIRRMQDDKDA